MQIIINQDEIELAIREVVLSQISIREDQNIEVRFETTEGGDVLGIIDIAKVDSEPKSGGSTNNAPKKRGRKASSSTPTQSTAASASQSSEEDQGQAETIEEVAQAVSTEEASQDAPVAQETNQEEEDTHSETVETQPGPATKPANASKIFPDSTTSAPTPAAREVDPSVQAKSLFANLNKATH